MGEEQDQDKVARHGKVTYNSGQQDRARRRPYIIPIKKEGSCPRICKGMGNKARGRREALAVSPFVGDVIAVGAMVNDS